MFDWFTNNSGTIVTVGFSVVFAVIAVWAYLPSNKKKLQDQANIPFHEEQKNG